MNQDLPLHLRRQIRADLRAYGAEQRKAIIADYNSRRRADALVELEQAGLVAGMSEKDYAQAKRHALKLLRM